jgi:hypothetical protein
MLMCLSNQKSEQRGKTNFGQVADGEISNGCGCKDGVKNAGSHSMRGSELGFCGLNTTTGFFPARSGCLLANLTMGPNAYFVRYTGENGLQGRRLRIIR